MKRIKFHKFGKGLSNMQRKMRPSLLNSLDLNIETPKKPAKLRATKFKAPNVSDLLPNNYPKLNLKRYKKR